MQRTSRDFRYLQGLVAWELDDPEPALTEPDSSTTSCGLPISIGLDTSVAAELFDLLIELRRIDDDRPIRLHENDFLRDFSFSPRRLSCGLKLLRIFSFVFLEPILVPIVLFLRSRLMVVLDRSVASSFTCLPPVRIKDTTSTCCRPCTG